MLRNKFYSALNISGLAIGLAVGIMILLWVQDELSYDRFHAKAENIYKINSHLGSGDDEQIWQGAPAPVLHMAKKVPEIENGVRTADYYDNSLFAYNSKRLTGLRNVYVDPWFFEVFDYKILRGNEKSPFDDSHSVIITESIATKFFGDEDPIGKVIIADKRENFKVSAIVSDFPQNSVMQYDMIFPMSLKAERFGGNGEWKTIDDDLGNFIYNIYFVVKRNSDPNEVGAKLSRVYETTRNELPTGKIFSMQALTDLHLYGADGNDSAMQIVRIFTMVAIFILIIACINYVNLSTARSILRSKEVSMRKIIGAEKKQLFTQFVIETALIFIISAVAAFFIIQLLLPLYNQISQKELVFSFYDTNVWLILGAAIGGSMALASIYPALLLSSFKPIEALKGKVASRMGNASFRKVLVVTQFAFSAILITATIVVTLQLKYIREKDLGFDKEHVFTFYMRDEMRNHAQTVRNEMLRVKGVRDVSFSNSNIVEVYASTGDTDWEGKDEGRTFLVHPISIDEHFIPLFGIDIIEGRNFNGSKGDSASVILNETAVKEAGIVNPIGKKFVLWENSATIVGVIKDYNYASLKKKVEPAVYYQESSNNMIFVKTSGADANDAIEAANQLWKKYSADYPFNYTFVDEAYDKLYRSERRTEILFNTFAIVAITISCLGLLGLATYTAEVKRREVSIRKVLGASTVNITGLLARNFVWLVFVSLFIAVPVSWWTMNAWLQDFVYRITLSWWIFALAGGCAMLIALLTVGVQAVKAAMVNPVKSLRGSE